MEDSMKPRIIVPVEAPKLNISEIEEVGAFYYRDDPNVLYVKCKPKNEYTGPCPHCGCFNYYKHGTSNIRHIHDISMGLTSIDIILKQDRFKCKEWLCGATFNRPLSFAQSGVWMTNRLIRQIEVRSVKESYVAVAEEYGITDNTVKKILRQYGEKQDSNRKLVAPRVLGIDEVHIKHKMRGVFVDIERGKLLEMTVDNKRDTMAKMIESMEGYENIEFVTMDMSNAYKPLVEEILPQATIIVDKFHVVSYIYKATTSARTIIVDKLRAQVSKMPASEDKKRKEDLLRRLGKESFLFKYGSDKLTEDEDRLKLMALLCKEFPELNELRLIKTYAENIYNSENAVEATKAIQTFQEKVPRKNPDYKEFVKFAGMLIRWMPEIMNYFIHGQQYTNATTEGVNSLIKQINGVGRGYTFKMLRYKCLYQPESKKNLKARPKPTIEMFNYQTFIKDEYTYEADINYLLDHFDEIF